MKSLGCRVPAEWVAREVKLKIKLEESEVFPIVEDHLILRFKSDSDCALVRKGSPWFVTDQLLAMEPNFVSSHTAFQKTIIWLRLPGLLMEFWLSTTIMVIAAEMGRPLAIDNFTDHLKKTGYA